MTDRRTRRHRETKAEILEAAWRLADRDGIAGISLRDLAAEVDMRAPSLYNYFESKDALYDAMFEEANDEVRAFTEEGLDADPDVDPVDRYIRGTLRWMEWCQASLARYQLLYTRAIPGWEPSPHAYASAGKTLEAAEQALADVGVTEPRDIDLVLSVAAGLIAQQMANDPTGDRWTKLAPEAIRLVVDHARKGAHT